MRRRPIDETVRLTRALRDADVDVTIHVSGVYRPARGPRHASGGEPAEWPDAQIVSVEGEDGPVDDVPQALAERWCEDAIEAAMSQDDERDEGGLRW